MLEFYFKSTSFFLFILSISSKSCSLKEASPSNCSPLMKSLSSILRHWQVESFVLPKSYRESIRSFNYSDVQDRKLSKKYRAMEIPYKMIGLSKLDLTSGIWSDDYLEKNSQGKAYAVERSKSNHFLYWNLGRNNVSLNYKTPTDFIKMSFKKWLLHAIGVDKQKYRSVKDSNITEYLYLHMNVGPEERHSKHFIVRDLPFFSSGKRNFFVADTALNDGIECRFGMQGVTIEAHADGSQNMVAMIRGRKRFILVPPQFCSKLSINTDLSHPSYRQSMIDWSKLTESQMNLFDSVQAVETILGPGEILYVPSFWFHYIVSLELSVQCNSRSPYSSIGKHEMDQCLGIKKNSS